jgi:hypothetical protein
VIDFRGKMTDIDKEFEESKRRQTMCYECEVIHNHTGEYHPNCPRLEESKKYGLDTCYIWPVLKNDIQKWNAGERRVIGQKHTMRLLAQAGWIAPEEVV